MLHESEYAAFLYSLPQGVAVFARTRTQSAQGAEHDMIEANDAFRSMVGEWHRHARGETDGDAGSAPDSDPTEGVGVPAFIHEAVSQSLEAQRSFRRVYAVEAWDRYWEVTTVPLTSGRCGVTVRDVTESTRAEAELRASEERFRAIFENANDAIYLFELTRDGLPGRILEVNQVACDRLGYSREEYLDMDPAQMDAPENDVDIPGSMQRLLANGHETIELIHMAKDGTRIPVEVSSHLYSIGGRRLHLAIVRDITERKEQERRLRRSVEEKTVLLREIHHRVKNNMQLISSLLSLQAQHFGDSLLSDAFREAQNRVATLALIHEKLYQAKDLARVDFREYLDDLTRAIAVSHARDDCPVTVHQSVEVSRLPIPTVIPVALVVSELLTNTYKHAFTGCSYGNVWIEFGHDDGLFRLRITDDGVGLPEDAATQGMEGLGMELVSTLAEQLGGDLRIGGGRHGGARFVLEFPESADSGDPAH